MRKAIVLAVAMGQIAAVEPQAQGEVIAARQSIDQPAAVVAREADASVEKLTPAEWSMTDLIMPALAIGAMTLFVRKKWHRLAGAPAAPILAPPLGLVVLFLAFWFLKVVGLSAAMSVFGIDAKPPPEAQPLTEQAKLMLGVYAAQAIALAVVIYLMVTSPNRRERGRPSVVKAGLIGAGMLLLALPVVMSVGELAGWIVWIITGEKADVIAHETLQLLKENSVDGWYIALACMVVLVTPVMEEVMYRGLVQRSLVQAGLGRWPAIVLASAAFALMHGGIVAPHAMASLFVLSIGFGWASERTGRLATSIVMHMLFNAVNLGLALWMI